MSVRYLLALRTAIDLVEIWRSICCMLELQKERADSLQNRSGWATWRCHLAGFLFALVLRQAGLA
jgi:hypothetical protein